MENQIPSPAPEIPQNGQPSINQSPILNPQKTNFLSIAAMIFACAVIFGLGGYYWGQQSKQVSQQNKNETIDNPIVTPQLPNICSNFDDVTDSIKTSLAGNYRTTVRNIPIIDKDNIGFFWRRNITEPMVSYPSQKSRQIYLYGQPSDKSAKMFEEIAILALKNLSLMKNDLNYSTYSENSITDGGSAMYGFLKEKDYYVIHIDGAYVTDVTQNADGTIMQETKLPENSTGINISCGVANPLYDDVYNKIIKTGVYDSKDKIGMTEIVDSVVGLSVGTVAGFGGHASFWIIKDNAEQLIVGTQEAPQCSIFESKKVGKGIDCYDLQSQTQRTVTY